MPKHSIKTTAIIAENSISKTKKKSREERGVNAMDFEVDDDLAKRVLKLRQRLGISKADIGRMGIVFVLEKFGM